MNANGSSRRKRTGGFAVIEFTICAIPLIFVTLSILEMSLDSWKFHSMAWSINEAARYACAHGRTCTRNSNTCTVQVKDVAFIIADQAPSLDTTQLNVTLTTHDTSVSCNPLSSCTTRHCPPSATCTNNTSQFPPATENFVGYPVTITATYPMHNPIAMMWFGSSASASKNFTLGATTTQTIVY